MVCKNSLEKEVKYKSESQKKVTRQNSMEYRNSQINSAAGEISGGANVNEQKRIQNPVEHRCRASCKYS